MTWNLGNPPEDPAIPGKVIPFSASKRHPKTVAQPKRQRKTKIDPPPPSTQKEVDKLCRELSRLSPESGGTATPDTEGLSQMREAVRLASQLCDSERPPKQASILLRGPRQHSLWGVANKNAVDPPTTANAGLRAYRP
jgi:hypothetical protein